MSATLRDEMGREIVEAGKCIVPDCAANAYSRGICRFHYRKAREAGNLNAIARVPMTSQEVHDLRKPDHKIRSLTAEGYVRVRNRAMVLDLEHRVAMETQIGRALRKGENVHHINGVRHDNRLENLELWYSAQPYGQRVEQLIAYMLDAHSDRLRAALSCCCPTDRLSATSDTTARNEQTRPAGGHTKGEA